jgi:hypothetical protein
MLQKWPQNMIKLKLKLKWIHEHVSTAKMAPKTNHIKSNSIHVHVTKIAPKSYQMKLILKRIHEHVSIAEMAPKTNHTKSNWSHVHVTRTKKASEIDQMTL